MDTYEEYVLSPGAERASKPLAHALDSTLSILMEQAMNEISSKVDRQQEVIKHMALRVDELENKTANDGILNNHLASTENMIRKLERDMETKIAQQLQTNTERQREEQVSARDLQELEQLIEEVNSNFKAEVQKRHAEVEQINAVLENLDMLFETRDDMYAAQRRSRIEAQLRGTVFRMQKAAASKTFNTWATWYRKQKKMRHLLTRGVSTWKNRLVAAVFGPWAAAWRDAHRQNQLDALEGLQDHADGLAKRLGERIDHMNEKLQRNIQEQYDGGFEEGFRNVEKRVNSQLQEIHEKIEDGYEILHAKVEQQWGSSIEEIERRMRQADNGAANNDEILQLLDEQRRARIDATLRATIGRMKSLAMTKGFVAWKSYWKHAKKMQNLLSSAARNFKNQKLAICFEPWMAATRYQMRLQLDKRAKKSASEGELLRVIENSSLGETLRMHESRMSELEETTSEISDSVSTQRSWVEKVVNRLESELGVNGHAHVQRQRKTRERAIEKTLGACMRRWAVKNLRAAFDGFRAQGAMAKRKFNLASKCIKRLEIIAISQAFVPLLEAARALQQRRSAGALEALEARTTELSLGMAQVSADGVVGSKERRMKWIKNTLSHAAARWLRKNVVLVWQSWAGYTLKQKRVRNLAHKTIAHMENLTVALCFSPWLRQARDFALSRQQGVLLEIQQQSSDRMADAEQTLSEQLDALRARMDGDSDDLVINRIRFDLEERLEFLEVSLREEFQHVEVRCDIIGREFGRLQGKSWRDAGHPTGTIPAVNVDELGQRVGQLQTDFAAMQDQSGTNGEMVAETRRSVENMQGNIARVLEMQSHVDSIRESQTALAERVGQARQEPDSQLPAKVVAEAVLQLPQLKAQVHGLERELSSLRHEQQHFPAAITALTSDVARFKSDVANIHQTNHESKRLSESAMSDIAKVRTSVASVKSEFGGVQGSIDIVHQVQQDGQRTANELATLKGHLGSIRQVQEQSQRATTETAAAMADIAMLGSKLEVLETSILQRSQDLDRCISSMEQGQADDDELHNNVEMITEKLEALQHMTTSMSVPDQAPSPPPPPPSIQADGLMMDELGTVTRRIATLKLEKEILTEQNDFESQERLEDVVEELTELQRALEQVLGQAGELMEDVLSDAELSTEDASPRARSGRYTHSKPVAKDRLQTREEAWARCGHTSLLCTLYN
jgi:hypothetical protein